MVLYLLHVIVGILVFISIIIMALRFKTNRILNSYLITISTVLSAYLILFGFQKSFNCFFFNYLNYYQVVLTLTPATYLFFKKLIFNIKLPQINDLCYFILPLFLYFYVGQNYNNKLYKYAQFIFFVIYIIFYLFLIKSLLNKHIWSNKKTQNSPQIVVNWVSFIFKMSIAFLLNFFVVLFMNTFNILVHYIDIVQFFLLIVFVIGYFKVNSTPELLFGNDHFFQQKLASSEGDVIILSVWSLENNKKISVHKDIYLKDKINPKLIGYIDAIEKISIIDFSFRNKNYSLNEMSIELGLPKYYIVYLFKYHCSLNFNDYKRLVRIYDSIILIQQGYLKNNTLNSLAEFVGFSSYNPFLISFKQMTGVSPFDYNKNRKIVNSDTFSTSFK